MFSELHQAWTELTAAGAPFEIAEVPVRGTSIRTYANAPQSLREVWLGSQRFGEVDHLVYRDERWTFDDAHRETAAVAGWLVSQGVSPGDRVAIAMRNYPEWMLVYWATLSLGATVVGMNAWWTGPEMVYALEDSTPAVLVCDSERLERLTPHRAELPPLKVVAVRITDGPTTDAVPYSELRKHPGVVPDDPIDTDTDACIFYTSGTTGQPKGARLTHRSCVSNLMSIGFWGAVVERSHAIGSQGADSETKPSEPPTQMVSLVSTPLFHVTANNCVAHGAVAAGGRLVMMYKWDPTEALQLIERERVTNFTGVPTMTREMLAHPQLNDYDTSSLKIMGGGGAAFQPDLVKKVEAHPGRTRPNTGYGLTETSGIITTTSADFHVAKPDSVGPIMPCFEAACYDEDGNQLPVGEVGELWVRGAHIIAGYLNKPEATAEAITDGWFHTGDIGRLDDDGFLYIVDRLKDMVLRGGENIYSAEVEVVLFDHPEVVECAVFGVPDERLGEELAAAVVTQSDTALSADQLREHCAARLAQHKIPRYIWMLSDPLPRNANGKFLKRQLREDLDPTLAT
ncbi:acyl--CoA ligase [Myxococcota bacterium]|nr:acyl--CoA ligase [Myxococcota bacterium]